VRRLFQTRAFFAAALMLLLGAVRCINACEIAVPSAKKHGCHQSAPTKPEAKPCGQLAFLAPQDEVGLNEPQELPPFLPLTALAACEASSHVVPAAPFQLAASPPAWLTLPLRL
jgi:hypothetical protein